jgi:hypothetical protein
MQPRDVAAFIHAQYQLAAVPKRAYLKEGDLAAIRSSDNRPDRLLHRAHPMS